MNTPVVPDGGRTEIDLVALVTAIDVVCRHRQISALKASREIGIRPVVISNMRRGVKPGSDNTAAIFAWLHADASLYMRPRQERTAEVDDECEPEAMPLSA